MLQNKGIMDFLLSSEWIDLPKNIQMQSKLCLLDLIGVAAGGSRTKLSRIARDYAQMDMTGNIPMIFDGRGASVAGVALSGGMTIDALDGHDGFNLAKGHAGCGLLPALYAVASEMDGVKGSEFLHALTLGYEIACRTAISQHATSPDYHTSGAWVAVAVAAVTSRVMGLSNDQALHAMGIAEYHGPRSQMMRCIDYPTMVKDGSGWGAMCGVSAARMAAAGFTGAPAVTLETQHWSDLNSNWLITQQYFKPYPVCRWAQGPIAAVLDLKRQHKISSKDISEIRITSFHEAVRLGQKTATNTEQAQYSTSFPCAVALVHGTVLPEHVADDSLNDPEVQRLSSALTMVEDEFANKYFPARRLAHADIKLATGQILKSDWFEPHWDATKPPSKIELENKFHNYAIPVVGNDRANAIHQAVMNLDQTCVATLFTLLSQPIN